MMALHAERHLQSLLIDSERDDYLNSDAVLTLERCLDISGLCFGQEKIKHSRGDNLTRAGFDCTSRVYLARDLDPFLY